MKHFRDTILTCACMWLLSLSDICLCQPRSPQQGLQVPCFFIFGDSLVDNGNNNGMLTLARANYRPYGIDFPQGPTGRFTNGRTYVDALAQLLGFPTYIPPYSRARGLDLLRGANYASGAAGIREETGSNLGAHTSMNEQVSNFGETVQQLRSSDYTARAFATILLQQYGRQLAQLYSLGARKVIVTAVGQIGCIPYQLARFHGNNSRCNEKINSAIQLFNSGLKRMVQNINGGQLPGAKFVYLDFYQSSQDLSSNGTSLGFDVVDKGCCGVGKNNGQITCLPLQQPCQDRHKYLFWDAFHPTELANILLAKATYTSQSYTYPINIQQLAAL
ncbi:hypothetical protein AAHE18_05G290400 [Arachis hypogaea]